MISLTSKFKDSFRHCVVAVLDFIDRALVEDLTLFLRSFEISFSLRGWLHVESKTICDHYEAKGKLFTKVKKMVCFFLRPICIGNLASLTLIQHLHYLLVLFVSVSYDFDLPVKLSKWIGLFGFLGFGPMM